MYLSWQNCEVFFFWFSIILPNIFQKYLVFYILNRISFPLIEADYGQCVILLMALYIYLESSHFYYAFP